MSDLAAKFAALELQMTTQQTEVINALNAILIALGAPPPTATETLADTNLLLTAINNNLIGMRGENVDFYAALLDSVGLINANTDTMINNNSLNAQRLLIAIAANDPCKSCDIVPIEPPPLDVTPQTPNQEHCQRMQALIYALLRFTVKLDVLSSFGLGFSPTVIRDAITEIYTELGVSGDLEFPSLGEVAQLAGAGAAYIVSNIFSSTSLPFEFQSISDELLTVLYDTDNASAGQSAYRSFLDGSGLDSTVIQLFKAMAYTSIFNLYYDSTNDLDVSGYDGTICAPEEELTCYTFTPEQCTTIAGHYGTRWIPDWSIYDVPVVAANVYGDLQAIHGEWAGWTFEGAGTSLYFYQETGDGTGVYVGMATSGTVGGSGSFNLVFQSDVGAFSLTLCPPGL